MLTGDPDISISLKTFQIIVIDMFKKIKGKSTK